VFPDDVTSMKTRVDDASKDARWRVRFLGVVAPALAGVGWLMFKSTLLLPRFLGVHAWVFSRDLFVPLPAAKYASHGAIFQMYEPSAGGTIGYPYTPGLPLLLSPLGWLGDRFALTDNLKYAVPRPGMFLLVAPAVVLLAIVPLLSSVGAALRGYLEPGRIIAVQWAVTFATAAVTVVYLHPEDAIACAGLVGSASAVSKGQWRRAGVLAAVAILFKQWAAIPAVVLVAAVPRRDRLMFAFYTYALPALLMLPFFLATFSATSDAMTGAQATLSVGHQQLWTSAAFRSDLVSATPLRFLWLLCALGIAWTLRNRTELPVLLAAIGLVMLARLLCEPTIFAYYLGPAFALGIICAALSRQPIALRTFCALAVQLWCGFHHVPEAMWWAVLGAGTAYICAPLFTVLRSQIVVPPAPPRPVPSVA
jgi:hypothetical protein